MLSMINAYYPHLFEARVLQFEKRPLPRPACRGTMLRATHRHSVHMTSACAKIKVSNHKISNFIPWLIFGHVVQPMSLSTRTMDCVHVSTSHMIFGVDQETTYPALWTGVGRIVVSEIHVDAWSDARSRRTVQVRSHRVELCLQANFPMPVVYVNAA